MMWFGYEPASWAWMVPVMVLFWAFVIAFILVLVRAASGRRAESDDDDAMSTLRRRLAAGEITREEYEQTRRVLLG